jgi:hypothetical protein
MTNTQYSSELGGKNRASGMKFEYRVLADIRRKKPEVINHSIGSRGLVDIVARYSGKVVWITCKINGYVEPVERKKLEALKKKLTQYEIILVARERGGKLEYNQF